MPGLSKKDKRIRAEKKAIRKTRKPVVKKSSEAKSRKAKILIDLNSVESDTSNLLFLAQKWSTQLKLNYSKIHDEMVSSNTREELIEVFKSHFGMFVTFYE